MKPEFSKPFDHAAAQAGAPYSCADGTRAEILKWDLRGPACPIAGAIDNGQFGDQLIRWTAEGVPCAEYEASKALVMLPLGLIDGKPVFVGDELVREDGERRTAQAAWWPDIRATGFERHGYRWPTPAKVYPKFIGDLDALRNEYNKALGEEMGRCLQRVADATLRHACDAGQVAPISEARPGVRPHNPYTGALRDPRDIETDPMGVLIRHVEELAHTTFNIATDSALIIDGIGPIYGSAKVIKQVGAGLRRDLDRAARDMVVAKAIRDVCMAKVDQFHNRAAQELLHVDLAAITQSVQ